MDPLQDPVPGNSAKKSDSEDDIPLAAVRERKDAKGKVKKSSNIKAKNVAKGKSGSSDVIESKVVNVDKEKKAAAAGSAKANDAKPAVEAPAPDYQKQFEQVRQGANLKGAYRLKLV